MPFFQPAVRAHQATRHPALDGSHGSQSVGSPPGAGDSHPDMYYHELGDDHNGPPLPTTDAPSPTAIVADAPAPSIENTPTPITDEVPTSALIIPEGLTSSSPEPEPSSTLSAAIGSSDTIPSSSPLSSSSPPVSTPTTTSETSSTILQSPVSGSTAAPMTGGITSSVSSPDSVLAGAESNSSHLSGGVIAAIVIVLLLVLCAVTFFVLRWRRIRKRAARRMTWTANLSPHPNSDSSLEKGTSGAIDVASQSPKEGGNGDGASPTLVRNIARKPPLPYSPVSPTAPPQSRGNPPDVRASSVGPTSVSRVSPSPTQDMPVLVRMTFIPQLPDELAITPGETLYIQTEFDDGWAMCTNIGGKEGMVPLECVEGVGGQFAGISHTRIMRRASSLRSASSWT